MRKNVQVRGRMEFLSGKWIVHWVLFVIHDNGHGELRWMQDLDQPVVEEDIEEVIRMNSK